MTLSVRPGGQIVRVARWRERRPPPAGRRAGVGGLRGARPSDEASSRGTAEAHAGQAPGGPAGTAHGICGWESDAAPAQGASGPHAHRPTAQNNRNTYGLFLPHLEISNPILSPI